MKIFINIEAEEIKIISDASEDAAPNLKIETSLASGGKVFYFEDNFRFGISVIDGPSTIYSATYPSGLEKYISTDQEIFKTEYITGTLPEHEYTLLIWCINGLKSFEKAITFNTSLLGQPFPSWSFSEELLTWIPPIPMPEITEDGKIYRWDEDIRDWVIVDLPTV